MLAFVLLRECNNRAKTAILTIVQHSNRRVNQFLRLHTTSMGIAQTHRPVLLICAVISRYDEAFDWSLERFRETWGESCLVSPRFDFVETTFYQATMGGELKKQFFAFDRLIDPTELPNAKLQSNQWEIQYARARQHAELRPLNLDPGYLTEAKLVLATTKDRDHRIYLDQGIFAEVTLHFHKGQWCNRPWTYPDYQRADFQAFFSEARNWLRKQYRSSMQQE
jgi:hypothetical protein